MMIAEFLVRECAVVTAQEQTLGSAVSDCLVDLSRNVYVRYHVVDGFRYIKSLQNSQSGTDKEEQLVYNVRKTGTASKIVIAEDHLGIRLVHFSSNKATGRLKGPDIIPSQSDHLPSTWWRTISRPGGITKIRAKFDVSRAATCVST